MKTKLLKLIRKRVCLLYNTETEQFAFRDNKVNEYAGGIYGYEYESKWSSDRKYITEERDKYILDTLRFEIYNKRKWFWQKSRHKKSNIIEL